MTIIITDVQQIVFALAKIASSMYMTWVLPLQCTWSDCCLRDVHEVSAACVMYTKWVLPVQCKKKKKNKKKNDKGKLQGTGEKPSKQRAIEVLKRWTTPVES